MTRMKLLVFWLLCLATSGNLLWAGNTGKLTGTIKDKQSGEVLVGANVTIKGTNLGAASDLKGNYTMLQIPPGKYEVVATYIGYHKMTVQNVIIKVDLTTRLNFEMQASSIEAPTLTVMAEEPLVQKDITSTRKTTSRDEIQGTPGFETSTDIFLLHGGTVIDAAPSTLNFSDGTQLQVRDESLKDIHVRGGRGGEILYMVDGVPVTHPIYGGRDVLDLNVVDIQEMELLTGAFSAEYGQAQSGVVNITTRTGSERFEGGLEFKTSEVSWLGDSYDAQYLSFFWGGPEPITQRLLPKIGLTLPGHLSFFLSGNGNLDDTPYSNHRNREKLNLLGFDVSEKQDNTGNLNAKLNWKMNNALELIMSYHGSWKSWTSFEWLWKNYPNNMASYSRSNQNMNLRLQHTLSKNTFYNLNLGYLTVDYNGSLNNRTPGDYWLFYKEGSWYNYANYSKNFSGAPDSLKSIIKAPATDGYGFFDTQSFQSLWRDDYTRTLTFKGDITSQFHPEHLLKMGFQVQYNDIHYVDIQDGGEKLSNYGSYIYRNDPEFITPIGPYKEFGQNRWVFNAFSNSGGVYFQDKFEKESLIINAGIRTDWFMPGSSVAAQDWKTRWENATGLKADWSDVRFKFSPRFGISFPISDKTVLFFSYGHFNQLPELQFYYRDPYTGGFTGNPHLDFEQTILYEFGFTHQLIQNWAIDIKSYTKDISKQVNTTRLRAALGLPVDLYDNNGYSRARGLEFELVKRYSRFTSGKATYTVQWATGYSSSAFDDYIRSLNDFPNPIRERRLNWDVRHQFIIQTVLASPPKKPITLFGLRLPDNWSLTCLWKFSSGQPYTFFTLDPVVVQKKENLETGPATMTIDLKFKKTFELVGLNMSVFLDVFNLFDQKNVQIAYGFNNLTGKPYRYGDVDPQLTLINTYQYINWHSMYNIMDPRQFSSGRHVKLGLSLDF